MSLYRETTTKQFDKVFVLTLLTLFAATSLILVLIGAKQYRYVTNRMNQNFNTRTTAAYLTEKIRQNDIKNTISITDLQGCEALSIHSAGENYDYTTYIYCYEGFLRELVVTKGSVYSLSSGQPITEITNFRLTLYNNSLLKAELETTPGEKLSLYFHIQSGMGKEAA